MRLAKALITLHVYAGWSEPLLVAHTTSLVFHVMAQIIMFSYSGHPGLLDIRWWVQGAW